MAHSLLNPLPEPFIEKLWRHMKSLCLQKQPAQDEIAADYRDPIFVIQAKYLDARGQQELLEEVFDLSIKKGCGQYQRP